MASKPFHEMMADKMASLGGGDGADEEDSPGGGGALKAAAQAVMDAVHSKDVDALADALKSAVALCDTDDGAGDEGEGDDGGSHAAMLLIPHGKGH